MLQFNCCCGKSSTKSRCTLTDSEDKLTFSFATEEILEHRYSIPHIPKFTTWKHYFKSYPIFVPRTTQSQIPIHYLQSQPLDTCLCLLCPSSSVPLKPGGSRAPLRVPCQYTRTWQISPFYMHIVDPSPRLAKTTFSPQFGVYLCTNAHYR